MARAMSLRRVFSFEVAGDDRGALGNQVGLARQVEVEGFEAPRGQ